jgi:hypothetical protein
MNEIDAELSGVQATIAKLEGDKQKNLALLETAKSTREQTALAALSGSDAKAQDSLKKARASQREIEMLLEDLTSAEGEARRRLESLRAERDEAARSESWVEFTKVAATAQSEAQVLSGAIMGLGQLLAEHDATLRQMTNLAAAAGRPTTAFRLRHLIRFMESMLNRVMPLEFSKGAEVYRNGVYVEFLQEQIDRLANRAAPQTEEAKESA